MPVTDTLDAEGHLIDSGVLSAIFDKIIEVKAAYEIVSFDIGRNKTTRRASGCASPPLRRRCCRTCCSS